MRTRFLKTAIICSLLVFLTACRDIQIFESKPITEAQEVSSDEMARDTFYVKIGTKFSSVYLPDGNAENDARKLTKSRVLFFLGDEPMVPTHYKGEILAYKSATLDVKKKGITLERYKDLGYSLGVYGGVIGDDGFYHLTISKGTALGSNIQTVLAEKAQIDEIRIVSIGGRSVKEYFEPESGVLVGLEKDKSYTVEFYLGTYYYSYNFVADTHFLQAYEYYVYENNVDDTKLGYVSFTTPDDLKSGYYNVNGTGLFKYYAYEKGNVPEDLDMNESYYSNEKDQILQYTRQYSLKIPVETKDMLLTVEYGGVTDDEDVGYEIGGYLISPEGTVYKMATYANSSALKISLESAMPGDWTIGIFPRSLQINGINTQTDAPKEESVYEELEFVIEDGEDYKAVYADIKGAGDVYGTIVAEDGRTYVLDVVKYKDDERKEQRYLIYRFPHITAGTYEVKIYHYKSETTIENLELHDYDPNTNELK